MTQKQQDTYFLVNKLAAWFLGVIMACSISGVLFMLKLLYQIPLIQERQQTVEKKIDVMQGSVNGLSERFTILSEEQIRQGEQLNNIKEKVK